MTFRHLEIFIAVADLGSMTRASRQLFISQPTVSQAIAELDQSFFRVRLDRLTPAERRYLRAMAEVRRITGEKEINTVGYCIAGTTLGLTLAQSFVQQHGGQIEMDSRPGHTEFRILLPLPVSAGP